LLDLYFLLCITFGSDRSCFPVQISHKLLIVYYVMRTKNEVLCAAAGRLAAERSEADKPAKAHKTIFAPNNIYYFFFKPS
jgi:hypothetical protein